MSDAELKNKVPYQRKRVLVVFDGEGGLVEQILDRQVEMLEARGFDAELLKLSGSVPDDLDFDPEEWDGLIVAAPVSGTGLRGGAPSPLILDFLDACDDLDELKVAVLTVYRLQPGKALEALEEKVGELGGDVICAHQLWLMRPTHEEHVVPAECMVRMR